MVRSILIAVAAFAAAVTAQTNFNSCCAVDPNTVQINTRLAWCRAQTNTCPELCTNGQTSVNTCDTATLTYNCTCLTGSGPGNVSDYLATLPKLECDEWVSQCTAAHPNDLAGQTFCQSYKCGQKNASTVQAAAVTVSSTTTGAAATGASTTVSSASISASRSAAAAATAAVHFGKQYGTAALGVAGAALFGLAL